MKVKVSITLDADIVRRLEKICTEEERTTSNLINKLLRQTLNAMDENKIGD